jgi:hypothetical protein
MVTHFRRSALQVLHAVRTNGLNDIGFGMTKGHGASPRLCHKNKKHRNFGGALLQCIAQGAMRLKLA